MKLPSWLVPSAAPLYTPPASVLTTVAVDMPPVIELALAFHATIFPSSLTAMNVAPKLVFGMRNWLGLGFHTSPVGAQVSRESCGLSFTTKGAISGVSLCGFSVYTVSAWLPLFATH